MRKSMILMVFALAGCTVSGDNGKSAASREECAAAMRKGLELQGMSEDTITSDPEKSRINFAAVVRECAERRRLSRKGYECIMNAQNLEEYLPCQGLSR